MPTPIEMYFADVSGLIEWLPDAPQYVEGDAAWMSREQCAVVVGLSESGLDAVRRRMGRAYEHRDSQRRVWVYFPLWHRVYYEMKASAERHR